MWKTGKLSSGCEARTEQATLHDVFSEFLVESGFYSNAAAQFQPLSAKGMFIRAVR
jgi:hypothetical protein